MQIKKNAKDKLLDMKKAHSVGMTEMALINRLSSELDLQHESLQNILAGKEEIKQELEQRIDEQYEKMLKHRVNPKKRSAMLRKLRREKPSIEPELGQKIENITNNIFENKFGNKDKELTIGLMQDKIDSYEKLKFSEKILSPRDFNYGLYNLQDIPNIPGFGEQVTIVDCNNGKEYTTNIHESQHSISNGLRFIWEKFHRRQTLKPGDIIGIAIDQEDNHRIYVDFEYKDREKWDNEKRRYQKEDVKDVTKYRKYDVAIEKSIPWIKEQIENSKDGTIIIRAKDVGEEMGGEFEKKNPTSIYWGLRSVLRRHNIIVDQDVHDKSGDKLLVMRYRTEEDMPPSSPEQYIDGEVLQVPSLKDLENALKRRQDRLKELQEKVKNVEYDPEKEVELSQEKRRYIPRNVNGAVRDSSFRYRILNVYNGKCAICGLQMNMVEACHIIPVENDGTDEIINGMALCHNHHKAFDSGLIWINKEYNIMLNHSKIENIKSTNIAGGLDAFIKNSRVGEKIFLPDDNKFYPDLDRLARKRYTIFISVDEE